ncbi:hypothetical protein FNU76_03225 [Chitinimonas arctica]|uniref:Uncharacterized protein n=1 Tax=Chitinimonas arctica TaxID=2594795 RepID=A0A516SBC4_9NEIS|nr:hypothetical protein [Chitinimonas arctica]QDQ25446.1 hypothetical protein FNU76_03225 [Chitinimonas arctica]
MALKVPKPRNPFAMAASRRHAGVHDKGGKIKRRDARQSLRQALKQGREDFSPPFFFVPALPASG